MTNSFYHTVEVLSEPPAAVISQLLLSCRTAIHIESHTNEVTRTHSTPGNNSLLQPLQPIAAQLTLPTMTAIDALWYVTCPEAVF